MPIARRVILALLPLLSWPGGAAMAHAILMDSTPSTEAAVPAGRTDFQLRFNSRIDKGRSRLTLTPTGGAATVLPIASAGPPEILAAHGDLRPGAYTLRWQVLAVDGHVTRGDVPFTVTQGPAASATPGPNAPAPQAAISAAAPR